MNAIYETPSHDDLLKLLHAVLVEIQGTDDIEYANRLAHTVQHLPVYLLTTHSQCSALKAYDAVLNAAIPNRLDGHIHRLRHSLL